MTLSLLPGKPNRGFLLLALLCSTLLVWSAGCNLKKPYVGLQADTSNWQKYRPGVARTIKTNHFLFELRITEAAAPGEYVLEGTLDGSRGSLKSFNHLVIRDCRFSILLARNNVIVDNIVFFPEGDDHRDTLPFKKTFKTVPFDSFTIAYNVSVRG